MKKRTLPSSRKAKANKPPACSPGTPIQSGQLCRSFVAMVLSRGAFWRTTRGNCQKPFMWTPVVPWPSLETLALGLSHWALPLLAPLSCPQASLGHRSFAVLSATDHRPREFNTACDSCGQLPCAVGFSIPFHSCPTVHGCPASLLLCVLPAASSLPVYHSCPAFWSCPLSSYFASRLISA